MSRRALVGSSERLSARYDVALLDLDGVVYVGPNAVPGAPEALAAVRGDGMRLAYVTNNAARPPQAVAAHLTELQIAARPEEVITSAQAAARYLAERLPAGAEVLVVGTTGLIEALIEQGLRPGETAGAETAAVVQGYSPELNWRALAEGCIAIRSGVPWVATNLDPTVPSPRGPLPGNGSLVAALRLATGIEPMVTGKPDPTMHRETLIRTGAQRPIVVGDRLDTDIEGANAVGCASLLVLSGVTTPRDLLRATPAQRADYLGRDVSALRMPHPTVEVEPDAVRCGDWSVGRAGAELALSFHAGSAASPDGLDALRALASAAWSWPDSVDPDTPACRATDSRARAELTRLELDGPG